MKNLLLFVRYKIIVCVSLVLLTPLFLFSQPTPEDIQTSIENGLEWLVDQQDPLDGSWPAYYTSSEATTGLALYKLCERAYELNDPDIESPFDPDYEYYQNVINGFNWLFMQLTIHDIGLQDHTTGATGTMDDPDANGNGWGVCAQFGNWTEIYSTSILLTGIAASGTPDKLVDVSGSVVDGWTYLQVAQDMVDFLSWGQVEYPVPDITVEGGWSYEHVDDGVGIHYLYKGDQSNSGYAVLGLSVAKDFGTTIPSWVEIELDAWIDWIQVDIDGDERDGGSWYSYPYDAIGVNTLKVGNLLSQMAFVGDLPTAPRVLDAIDYLERHWYDASGGNSPPGWNGDPAQYQSMFCLMKGLVFIGIDEFGVIDWFEDFATVILAQQEDEPGPTYGSWKYSSGRGNPTIITEWALLTLEKIAPPPSIVYVDFDVHPTSWPNPINTKSQGVTPTAILGTEDFDVTTIDVDALYLDLPEGMVYPVNWAYEDVTQPAGTDWECNDTEEGPDGYEDLTLKFNTQELVTALGEVEDGDELVIIIKGMLIDGQNIEGDDCIVIKKKGNKDAKIISPTSSNLVQNYPNPFSGTTTITFTLNEANDVTLKIYNTIGVEVATLYDGPAKPDQKYTIDLTGDKLSEGIYLCVLQSNGRILAINKMLLMK